MPIGEQYKPTVLPMEADHVQEKIKDVDDGGPEFRPRMAEKLLRFLSMSKNIEAFQGKSAEEVFDNEESRRQFILNLSPEEYTKLLIGINGILRNKDRDEWGLDGKEVAIIGSHGAVWDFPEFEDKPILLEQSLQAAKKMIQGNRSLEDVALLLSSVTSSTHLFNDGNGRTSRFLLALVNRGYSKDKQTIFEDVLSSSDFSNSVNTGMLQPMITSIMEKEIDMQSEEGDRLIFRNRDGRFPSKEVEKGDLIFDRAVSLERQDLFKKELRNSWFYMFEAIFVHIKKDVNKYMNESMNMGLELVTPDLTNEAIDKIIATWRQLKRRHVELIIDSIANPDKEVYQMKLNNRDGTTETRSILSIYKKKIKRSTDESIYKKVFG